MLDGNEEIWYEEFKDIMIGITLNLKIPVYPMSCLAKEVEFDLNNKTIKDLSTSLPLNFPYSRTDVTRFLLRNKRQKSKTKKQEYRSWNKSDDDFLKEVTVKYSYSWKKIQKRVNNFKKHSKSIAFLKNRYKMITGKIK